MIYFKTKKKFYKWNLKGLIRNTMQIVLVTTVMLALSINIEEMLPF